MSIIFFDIDGTVMDLDGTIPSSAVTAVRRLRQAGHHCVINTGRPRLAMDPQLMDMDFDGLVCSCGQYIQLDGKIIRHVGFDRETSRKILEIGISAGAGWICTLRRRSASGATPHTAS